MSATVFLTGGSGFVGSAVLRELQSRGHTVRALAGRKPMQVSGERITPVQGSLNDPASLDSAIAGCDAVIHLVGIIMEKGDATFEHVHVEGTRAVVEAAKRNGIRRYVHMSALGARPNAVSDYHKTKFAAEEIVRASGLAWTILQPSLIHGPGGEFMQMEIAWAKKKAAPWLFMPYFGAGLLGTGGAGKLQPVLVGDVARAFVDCLGKPATVGQTIPVVGTQVVTWPEMHHIVSQAVVGKRRAAAGIPVWYAKLLTKIAPASLLPFNVSQVQMSREDNTGDVRTMEQAFGWTPAGFEASLESYAKTV